MTMCDKHGFYDRVYDAPCQDCLKELGEAPQDSSPLDDMVVTQEILSVDDIFKFDCNGRNSPTYGCNKPGDNSGEYVRLDKVLRMLFERGAKVEII